LVLGVVDCRPIPLVKTCHEVGEIESCLAISDPWPTLFALFPQAGHPVHDDNCRMRNCLLPSVVIRNGCCQVRPRPCKTVLSGGQLSATEALERQPPRGYPAFEFRRPSACGPAPGRTTPFHRLASTVARRRWSIQSAGCTRSAVRRRKPPTDRRAKTARNVRRSPSQP
jgi:hypothetical protein